jgi:hypothetical protein
LLVQRLRNDVTDVFANIEPDHVGKFHGTHGHAVAQCGLVDDFDRDAVLQGEHCLVQIGHEHAIDEKTGGALARQRQFVDPPREGDRRLDRIVAA